MTTKIKSYLQLFGLIIFIASCSKETTSPSPNPNPNPVVTQPPLLLKKFIVIDPHIAPPNDTIEAYVYTFDNLDRCTMINYVRYPGMETDTTIQYYNGTDTNMNKRDIHYNGASTTDYQEFFRYSSNGKMISDSTISIYAASPPSTTVYHYDIPNDSTVYTNVIPPAILYRHLNQHSKKDAAGNITFELDSVFAYNSSTGTFPFSFLKQVKTTYDTNPNPFYRIYPKRPTQYDYNTLADDIPFFLFIPQKNNILSETDNNGGPVFNYLHSFVYSYNTNGSPATVIFSNSTTGYALKGIFVY